MRDQHKRAKKKGTKISLRALRTSPLVHRSREAKADELRVLFDLCNTPVERLVGLHHVFQPTQMLEVEI